jgi:hypothetical protein
MKNILSPEEVVDLIKYQDELNKLLDEVYNRYGSHHQVIGSWNYLLKLDIDAIKSGNLSKLTEYLNLVKNRNDFFTTESKKRIIELFGIIYGRNFK